MNLEIERKFLVVNDAWKTGQAGTLIRQGYLSTDKERSVRIRVSGNKGVLTIKGASRGAVRVELEYTIPYNDAIEILDDLCIKPTIEKYRYQVAFGGHTWEVDEFLGANQGLVIAELELTAEHEAFDIPPWAGDEVTGDQRYYNVSLALNPFRNWK